MVIATNLDEFAEQWTLPDDDLRLWVCLHELAHHAVLGVRHVGGRLRTLLEQYAAGFEPDPRALEERLRRPRPGRPGRRSDRRGRRWAGSMRCSATPRPARRRPVCRPRSSSCPQLHGLVAVVTGVVDHYVDETSRVAARATPTASPRRCVVVGSPRTSRPDSSSSSSASSSPPTRSSEATTSWPASSSGAGAEALQRLWEQRGPCCRPPARSTPPACGWPASTSDLTEIASIAAGSSSPPNSAIPVVVRVRALRSAAGRAGKAGARGRRRASRGWLGGRALAAAPCVGPALALGPGGVVGRGPARPFRGRGPGRRPRSPGGDPRCRTPRRTPWSRR